MTDGIVDLFGLASATTDHDARQAFAELRTFRDGTEKIAPYPQRAHTRQDVITMSDDARAKPVPVSHALDRTFRISVTLKGLDGALEIIGGLVLLFVRPATIDHLARAITQHELSQDPHDFIARHLLHSAGHLTHGATLFAAIYLLSHGLAKVILVVAVLREHLWAYPGMIALILAFIAYQLYRLAIHLTVGLSLLTLFDAFVVWLTWREYKAKHGAGRVGVGRR